MTNENRPKPGWNIYPYLNPYDDGYWEIEQYFADGGECIATVEGSGPEAPSYPHAFDVVRKLWVRGGAFQDLMGAKAWAERIAGVQPRKPGDEREFWAHHPIAGVHPATRMRNDQ